MTTPLTITREMIYALAPDGRSVKAAQALARGQFRDLAANTEGTWLQASCQGSDWQPYQVKVDLRDGQARCACTCGSPKYPCKHVLGLLLQRLGRPGDFCGIATPASSRERIDGHVAVPLAAPPPAEAAPAKDEGEALLQAIYDEPGEDAHRLVYADWLEEHGGDAARAQLIRLQCQAARLREGSPERDKAEKEAERLLTKHRPRWLAGVPAFLRKERLQMVRGFPGRLRMTPAHVEKYGPALVEKHPVTAVRLTGSVGADEAGDLALLPMWRRISEVDFNSMLIQRERALSAFLASPYLTGLRALGLPTNHLTLTEVRVVAGFAGLGRLEALDLRENALNARSLEVLLAADLSQLRRLILSGNPLAAAGAEALAAWRPAAPLERLDLGQCGLSARAVKALLEAPALAGVRWLELSGNDLEGAAEALADSPALCQVVHLGAHCAGMAAGKKRLLRARYGERAVV